MLKKSFLLVIFSMAFSACATTPSVTVLQRSDDLSSKPSWVSLSNAVRADKENTYFLGYAEVQADSNKAAALRMSDKTAYAMPMEAMVDAFFQQTKIAEDLKKNSAVSEMVMSVARNSVPPMPGLRVSRRYWEVVIVKTEKGTDEQLHAYSMAEIPTSEYETAKKAVLDKMSGNSELKKNLDEIAKKQQEQLLEKK
jgi:hypothetical protein